MVINPVTVTLGRHEWEHVMRVLRTSASRLDPERSKARPALEHYVETIEVAITRREVDKTNSAGFQRFWSRHQDLLMGEAKMKWNAMSPLQRSPYYVEEV